MTGTSGRTVGAPPPPWLPFVGSSSGTLPLSEPLQADSSTTRFKRPTFLVINSRFFAFMRNWVRSRSARFGSERQSRNFLLPCCAYPGLKRLKVSQITTTARSLHAILQACTPQPLVPKPRPLEHPEPLIRTQRERVVSPRHIIATSWCAPNSETTRPGRAQRRAFVSHAESVVCNDNERSRICERSFRRTTKMRASPFEVIFEPSPEVGLENLPGSHAHLPRK